MDETYKFEVSVSKVIFYKKRIEGVNEQHALDKFNAALQKDRESIEVTETWMDPIIEEVE